MSPKLRQSGYYTLLWVVSLFFFAPVAWIVLSSFKTRDEILSIGRAHKVPTGIAYTPADLGHRALVHAENARLTEDAEAPWRHAVETCRAMNEPFVLAYALFRLAEAQSAAGDSPGAQASAGAMESW